MMIHKKLLFSICVLLTCFSQAQQITFRINEKNTAQTINNFGAAGAWYSEGIGRYWQEEKKKRMAELLFSKAVDATGRPVGIGLSAWRFNIGGGTAEQGDSSGISNPVKRVESFLSPTGIWNWNKQSGYMWFVREAAKYEVENLIVFSNTPPVQFTSNNLGFNLQKNYKTNLRDDKYADYAGFLASFLKHFDSEGIHFNYVSPVNEPQWDWSNKFGQMNQEGSPWHNQDIYKIVKNLDSALLSQNLATRILFPEAAILTALYEGEGHDSRQIQHFFDRSSGMYVGNMKTLMPVIAGHSYFTDKGDSTIINVRTKVRDTAARYDVPFWQSEYSMLADGYKEGKQGRIPAIDCALFLAKMIHHDLTVANAAAWQLWNAWEPSSAVNDVRYCLLALKTNAANTEGDFTVTKNLWALGHYSRFVRPGMQRIRVERSDKETELQSAQNVMLSAFTDRKTTVVVAINYSTTDTPVKLDAGKRGKKATRYLTTGEQNVDMRPAQISLSDINLPARSISTIVIGK